MFQQSSSALKRSDSWDFYIGESTEEPFCCSGNQDPEDIIWAGSDTEETEEEILANRRRYEEAAMRYSSGQLPILQSASLRGPFDQGWENPWRYRPREKPDWWQPGSGNMLFTRSNVLRMAADYGRGDLQPKEALAWCKAKAEKEAKALRARHATSDVESQSGSDQEDEDRRLQLRRPFEVPTTYSKYDGVNEEEQSLDELSTDSAPNHYSIDSLEVERSHAEESVSRSLSPDPVVKDHVDHLGSIMSYNSHNDEIAEAFSRKAKRPADSQWLKGSFGKRARWDSPKMSTPTPIAEQGDIRRQRRQHALTASPHPRSSRHRSNEFFGADEGLNDKDHASLADPNPAQPRPTSKRHVLTPGANSRLNDGHVIEYRPGAGIKLDETRSQSLSKDPSDNSYSRRKQKKSHLSASRSDNTPEVSGITNVHDDYDSVEEISFITEVAPSCKDLEKFQYRKRRRIETTEPDDIEDQGSGRFMPAPATMSDIQDQESNRSELTSESMSDIATDSPTPLLHNGSPGLSSALKNSVSKTTSTQSTIKSVLSVQVAEPTFQADNSLTGSTRAKAVQSSIKQDVPHDEITHSNHRSPSPQSMGPNSSWDLVEDVDQDLQTVPRAISASLDHEDSRLSPHASAAGTGSSPGKYNHIAQPSMIAVASPRPRFVESNGLDDNVEQLAIQNEGSLVDDDSTQSYNSTPVGLLGSADGHLSCPQDDHGNSGQEESSEDEAQRNRLIESSNIQNDSQDPNNKRLGHYVELVEEALSKGNQNLNAIGGNQERSFSAVSETDYVEVNNPEDTSESLDLDPQPQQGQESEQESWRGCVPQSPWHDGDVNAVTPMLVQYASSGKSHSNVDEEELPQHISSSLDQDSAMMPVERPTTPKMRGIRPFSDFHSPTSSPENSEANAAGDALLSTQLVLDAALNNPWTGSFRKPGSGKSRKRVSFGVLPSDDVRRESSEHMMNSPPPPAIERPRSEDISNDKLSANTFQRHFVAATKFKPILADNDALIRSSPAVGAMAEAFIAADDQALLGPKRQSVSPMSPSRHLGNVSKPNSGVLDDVRDKSITSFNTASSADRLAGENSNLTTLEMEENLDSVLNDVGDFLEEWSVDTELKKISTPSTPSTSKDNQSSGYKRSMFLGLENPW